MKQLAISSLLVTSIFLAGCTTGPNQGSTTASTTIADAQKSASWLFLVHAPNAKIIHKADGTLILTMRPITHIEGFTDRPARKTQITDVQAFIANIWNEPVADNFRQDHPNAAIAAVVDKNNKMLSDELVVLSQPRYDSKSKVLAFTINKMTKQEILHAEKLQDITVLIDDATLGFGMTND